MTSTHTSWTLQNGQVIFLLRPKEFDALPNGTVLLDVHGQNWTKGQHPFNLSTQGGVIPYGLAGNNAASAAPEFLSVHFRYQNEEQTGFFRTNMFGHVATPMQTDLIGVKLAQLTPGTVFADTFGDTFEILGTEQNVALV